MRQGAASAVLKARHLPVGANYVWEPPPSVWWEMRGHVLLLGLTEGPAAAMGHTEQEFMGFESWIETLKTLLDSCVCVSPSVVSSSL